MQIRDLRTSLNLSQDTFAKRLGLRSKSSVSKIETENAAAPHIAIKIAALSGGQITAEEISPQLAAIAELKSRAVSQ